MKKEDLQEELFALIKKCTMYVNEKNKHYDIGDLDPKQYATVKITMEIACLFIKSMLGTYEARANENLDFDDDKVNARVLKMMENLPKFWEEFQKGCKIFRIEKNEEEVVVV